LTRLIVLALSLIANSLQAGDRTLITAISAARDWKRSTGVTVSQSNKSVKGVGNQVD
jgi:hypothetical protein